MRPQVEVANEATFTRVAGEFSRLASALLPGHALRLVKTGSAAHQVEAVLCVPTCSTTSRRGVLKYMNSLIQRVYNTERTDSARDFATDQ